MEIKKETIIATILIILVLSLMLLFIYLTNKSIGNDPCFEYKVNYAKSYCKNSTGLGDGKIYVDSFSCRGDEQYLLTRHKIPYKIIRECSS